MGPQHQAGSDSLLTGATFFKMREVCTVAYLCRIATGLCKLQFFIKKCKVANVGLGVFSKYNMVHFLAYHSDDLAYAMAHCVDVSVYVSVCDIGILWLNS